MSWDRLPGPGMFARKSWKCCANREVSSRTSGRWAVCVVWEVYYFIKGIGRWKCCLLFSCLAAGAQCLSIYCYSNCYAWLPITQTHTRARKGRPHTHTHTRGSNGRGLVSQFGLLARFVWVAFCFASASASVVVRFRVRFHLCVLIIISIFTA